VSCHRAVAIALELTVEDELNQLDDTLACSPSRTRSAAAFNSGTAVCYRRRLAAGPDKARSFSASPTAIA